MTANAGVAPCPATRARNTVAVEIDGNGLTSFLERQRQALEPFLVDCPESILVRIRKGLPLVLAVNLRIGSCCKDYIGFVAKRSCLLNAEFGLGSERNAPASLHPDVAIVPRFDAVRCDEQRQAVRIVDRGIAGRLCLPDDQVGECHVPAPDV